MNVSNSSSPPPPSTVNCCGQQATYAAIIFAVGALFGCVPLWLRARKLDEGRLLSLGTLFGGGVFVAAGFVHLLGDAASSLDTDGAYPVAMLWCSIGFLVPLCIDRLASSISSHNSTKTAQALQAASAKNHASVHEQPATELVASRRASFSERLSDDLVSSLVVHNAPDVRATFENMEAAIEPPPAGGRLVSIVGTVVLFLALTVHSFIAGLVLGVDGEATGVFVAIIAHKGFAAWALGCSFARTAAVSIRAAWLWVLSFAAVTPLGIVVGASIASFAENGAIDTLKAIAAGFFLYVGIMETIAKVLDEEAGCAEVLLKLTVLLLGFGLMALLALWV
jgi:zinc transporter ZupT